jgi:hypothetical protein
MSTLQGIGTGVIRHALEALAADGLIIVRHGRPRSWPESPAVIRARAGGGPVPATTANGPGAARTSATR